MSVIGAFIVPHPPVILPEIGRGREAEIQKTTAAYREAARRVAELKPDVLVIASPHTVLYADYFHISPGSGAIGDLRAFGAGTPPVPAVYDAAFVEALMERARRQNVPAGTLGEKDPALDHGTLIPLLFLREAGVSCPVVRVGLSGLPPLAHYRLGQCVAQTAESLGRNAVIIASGDLSHRLREDGPYGFAPQGPAFDRAVTEAMAEGDFLRFFEFEPDFRDAAAECGLGSFLILAGTLDGRSVEPELLSYEGPFGVGYAVACFRPGGADDARGFAGRYQELLRARMERVRGGEDAYAALARLSLETWVRMGAHAAPPAGLPGEMNNRRAGVFVSIKKDGALRGCIGTVSPMTGSIAEEILRNAISAGTEDPRFDPVTVEELPDLVYSVDVLGTPEPVDGVAALDARRYGVIVKKGLRRGLLLPDLTGVDTPGEQIAIAREKAGIEPGAAVELERFTVERHR